MRFFRFLAGLLLAAVALLSCEGDYPVSTEDPLPLPAGMAENKDLSVDPGDSFYDYCNGSWIKKTPIPATGATGGLYDQGPAMEKRVEQLKAENADIRRMYELLDADSGQPEASRIFIDGLKDQLRKFYESYADVWKTVYSDTKLSSFPKKDEHSHARLRVNGVVMNTDLWYDLYGVDRNNILYLPPERRAVIW